MAYYVCASWNIIGTVVTLLKWCIFTKLKGRRSHTGRQGVLYLSIPGFVVLIFDVKLPRRVFSDWTQSVPYHHCCNIGVSQDKQGSIHYLYILNTHVALRTVWTWKVWALPFGCCISLTLLFNRKKRSSFVDKYLLTKISAWEHMRTLNDLHLFHCKGAVQTEPKKGSFMMAYSKPL